MQIQSGLLRTSTSPLSRIDVLRRPVLNLIWGDLHCFYDRIERLSGLAIEYFLLLLLEHLSDAFQAHLRLYDRNIQRPKR